MSNATINAKSAAEIRARSEEALEAAKEWILEEESQETQSTDTSVAA